MDDEKDQPEDRPWKDLTGEDHKRIDEAIKPLVKDGLGPATILNLLSIMERARGWDYTKEWTTVAIHAHEWAKRSDPVE